MYGGSVGVVVGGLACAASPRDELVGVVKGGIQGAHGVQHGHDRQRGRAQSMLVRDLRWSCSASWVLSTVWFTLGMRCICVEITAV